MPPVQIALYVVLGVALAISLVTDLRSRLIYNVVTLPTIVIALGLRLALVGWRAPTPELGGFGLLPGVIGLVVGFLIFLPFILFGESDGFGGGDVKLMAAVGACLGFPQILSALLYTALVGGLIAIGTIIYNGSFLRTLASTGRMLAVALRIRKRPAEEEEGSPRTYIPYGVAIALGTVWAVASELTHTFDLVSR